MTESWPMLAAAVAIALMNGPLGALAVWRRMAFFGDALAHAALLGVALALAAQAPLMGGVLIISGLVALGLSALSSPLLPNDTLLGVLAHGALGFGLIAAALLLPDSMDLEHLLLGDITAITPLQAGVIVVGAGLVLAALAIIWRPLLAVTVSEEIAIAEGLRPKIWQLAHTLLLAVALALAIRLTGVLLFTSLLIIPAATARLLARSPEQMAAYAAGLALTAALAGFAASRVWALPAAPTMVAAAFVPFALLHLPGWRRGRKDP